MVPQPCFFIVRPDTKHTTADGRVQIIPGPIVPLIAVDELPEWLDIAGVPRELAVEETIGLTNLGAAHKSNGSYAVRIIHDATPATRQQTAAVRDRETTPSPAAQAATPPPSCCSTPTPSPHSKTIAPAAATPAAHPADRVRSHWTEPHTGDSGLAGSVHNSHRPQLHAPQNQPPPQLSSGLAVTPTATTTIGTPNPGRSTGPTTTPAKTTEYCRHWCQFGTCKFDLECRYKHVMPDTPAALAEVGLKEIPRWFRYRYFTYTSPAAGRQLSQLIHASTTPTSSNNNTADTSNNSNNGHHLISLSPSDAAAAGLAGLDPRDVRVAEMSRLGLLPHPHPHPPPAPPTTPASSSTPSPSPAPSPAATIATATTATPIPGGTHQLGLLGLGIGGGGGRAVAGGLGGGNGTSASKKTIHKRVREAMAQLLFEELGLRSLGMGMGGKMGEGKKRARAARQWETNPLQKGREKKKPGLQATTKAGLSGGLARVEEMVATATATAAAVAGGGLGQEQTRNGAVVVEVPGPAASAQIKGGDGQGRLEDAGGQVVAGCEQGPAVQTVAVPKVGKLVDV
ncbi:hypothetical protein N658DRAFT_559444 [Parathielavia hyrcaniae]|uniref:C3H1-type domain-containing protein n=1 Tax=Parathielavia hyrcaniae TaxID=113614 RepID=A0AAN6Q2N8_9PEZI|nr:hypothetical protein N658DRAFT_559444 [Parathielavia hyrcaniae]